MKKTIIILLSIIVIIGIAIIYISTKHEHEFSEATCTTASTCECGEIQGEALGHSWLEATYEAPKTCELCGLTDGEPLTNADRGAANGDMVVAIDFKDIDPAIHSTYNAETGEITVDDTITATMTEKSPYFTEKKLTEEETAYILTKFLKGYHINKFDGNNWLQFAITGDTTYLNFDISATDLSIQLGQAVDLYLNSAEGQAAMQNDPNYELWLKTQQLLANENDEEFYKQIAEELGITVEEAKELINGGGNGGGGSAPVANPSTQQPGATDENFVTPETNNPDNGGNTGGSGGNNSGTGNGNAFDGWGNNEGNDGGDLVTDGTLNP